MLTTCGTGKRFRDGKSAAKLLRLSKESYGEGSTTRWKWAEVTKLLLKV